MNIKVTSLIVSFLLSLTLFGGTAVAAGTPDGSTPAEETICDALRDDGVTKGLYGLCVAFCEAQDIADENIPVTEEELMVLADEDNAPSGRILANYNKKKGDTDPHMPCLVTEPPCPCFTSEELSRIDGLLNAADAAVHVGANTSNALHVDYTEGVGTQQATSSSASSISLACSFTDTLASPPIARSLSTSAGTLTQAEWAACDAMLRQSIVDHDF